MKNKVYFAPQTKVIRMEATAILAGSTGATGEDVPWASKSRGVRETLTDNPYDWDKVK